MRGHSEGVRPYRRGTLTPGLSYVSFLLEFIQSANEPSLHFNNQPSGDSILA